MANINKPSYIFRYHTDSQGNLINVNVENSYQVSPVNNIVMLDQIPSETERLIIKGANNEVLTECFNMDEITQNTYYCDYNEGKVYFDATHQGKTKIISYYGRGLALISADRVFLPDSLSSGDVVETLQDLIDFGKECLEAIKTLGSAVEIIKKLEKNIEDGNVLNTALESNIAIGTPLQASLNKDIKDALVFKDQLKEDVADGKILNTQLNEIVNEGKVLKPELDQSLANAQGVIDRVNSAGNKSYLISAEQWVANTDNTISSAFTYRLKHDMNSENLQVNGLVSGFSTIVPYKTLGVNEILLISDERVNMKIVINASYYNGGADIAEEVIEARKGKGSLKSKIDNIDEQLDNIMSLNNKAWNCLGDSITEAISPGLATPYHKVLKDKYNMNVRNYGVGGTEISAGGTFPNPMCARYLTMDKNADIITIFGGINDFLHNVPLGDINSTDIRTFYGAMNVLCEGMYNNFINSKFGFITPLPMKYGLYGTNLDGTNSLGYKLKDYVDAILKVCNKYKIPCLDLYTKCGMDVNIDTVKTKYSLDGLHPNDNGHLKMSVYIEDFIKNFNGDLYTGNTSINNSQNQNYTTLERNMTTTNVTVGEYNLSNGEFSISKPDSKDWACIKIDSSINEFSFTRSVTTSNSQIWVVIGGTYDNLITIQINDTAIGNLVKRITNSTDAFDCGVSKKLLGNFKKIKIIRYKDSVKIVGDNSQEIVYNFVDFDATSQALLSANNYIGFLYQNVYVGKTIFTNGIVSKNIIDSIKGFYKPTSDLIEMWGSVNITTKGIETASATISLPYPTSRLLSNNSNCNYNVTLGNNGWCDTIITNCSRVTSGLNITIKPVSDIGATPNTFEVMWRVLGSSV